MENWKIGIGETNEVDHHSLMVVNEKDEVICLVSPAEEMDQDDVGRAKLISATPDLLAACKEFVRKVDCGKARSTKSYKQMSEAIKKATK